jgi:endonuclease I
MMKQSALRQFITIVALAWATISACGAIPSGYYTKLNGKTGADLKTAVYEIINPHTEVSSYSNLPSYFRRTDVYPNTNRWWDMYSDKTLYTNTFNGLNREHSFPKSWWKQNGSVEYTPAYVDLNHLYPSEEDANTAKSNYPLGIVASVPSTGAGLDNGVSKVGYPVSGIGGGAPYVFEPADEYKGDFARTYFYMVTCYQNLTWNSSYLWMLVQGTYPTLTKWAQTMLLDWAHTDEVSQKELDRNEVVYSIQNNRNPFIDFPDLADYIWGDKVGTPFYIDGTSTDTPTTGTPELITPTQNMELEFGSVAIGSSTTAKLHLRGENLTGSLRLRIYNGNADYFLLSDSRVAASYANDENGYWVTVTYTPTAIGEHSSRLLIDSGGLTGSIGIALTGSCLEVPTLSTPIATEATDITADSYVANWQAATEDVDFYVLTRTRYINGSTSEEQITADDNFIRIDDYDPSIAESYYVQSSRLGYLSDPSNTIFVSQSGIVGVDNNNNALGSAYIPGGVRLICGQPHTGGIVYDAMGRTVRLIPIIENNMELLLPSGVYYIVSDQSRRPVTVLVK